MAGAALVGRFFFFLVAEGFLDSVAVVFVGWSVVALGLGALGSGRGAAGGGGARGSAGTKRTKSEASRKGDRGSWQYKSSTRRRLNFLGMRVDMGEAGAAMVEASMVGAAMAEASMVGVVVLEGGWQHK